VVVWKTDTGAEARRLSGHGGALTALAFSPDGHLLATASWDNKVKVWDGRPSTEEGNSDQ